MISICVGIGFGEKVFYQLKHTQTLQKINTRWEHDLFVGVRKRGNELAIASGDGIHFVRSVKLIPFEKILGEDCVSWVTWAPWNRYKDAVDSRRRRPRGDNC